MSERKRKRIPFNIFGLDEEDFFGHKSVEGSSGYSISVTYDEKGKPLVKVQTHGDFDAAELRQDIERKYPGARIEGLQKQPLIKIVGEEETRIEREEPKPEKKKEKPKEKKEPLIRVIE